MERAPSAESPIHGTRGAAIANSLNSGSAAITQAIHRLGGLGKTQLAVEYAYRHSGSFQVVWWVESESPLSLAETYAQLATALELMPAEATDQEARVKAVRHWLEHHGGWLLVFDNATDAQSLRPYLPRSRTGRLLITSRNADWAGVAQPLSVPVLPREESIALLSRGTGLAADGAMDSVADELGDLPLALAQASGYIRTASISVSDYLELYRSRRSE